MDILNSLFGANNSPPPAAAAPAPPPALPANYGAFLGNLLKAATAGVHAKAPLSGRGIVNLLTGNDVDAATSAAQAGAPAAWQQFQDAQQKLQAGGLNTAQAYGATSGMTGVPIDPSNPMASVPALAKAYGGVMAPASGAAPQAPADPLAAQRSFYLRFGRLMQMMGKPEASRDFFNMASQGLPKGTTLLPNGGVVDGSSGQPVTMGGQDYEAQGAGKISAAETAPRVAGQKSAAAYQAGLDRGTHAINADVDSQHAIKTGIDVNTGLPTTTTDYDLIHGGKNTFAADNPFFAGQQAELKDLRAKSESADQGINLATQISNAANGLYTGKGAGALQDARKLAQAAAQLTGAKLDPKIDNDTSKFEQLKFSAQQLVAVASHDLSPRVAMNIYNQIAAVKPGEQTSIRGLRDIINNQLLPVFVRNKALYGATSDYYRKNPLRNDAGAVVPDEHPLQSFGVRSVTDAKPGDFYIDPQTGNLRQRPR